MNKYEAVLFDLDGTLLDTAPDLLFALNKLCKQYQVPELTMDEIRPIASLGSRAMLNLAFSVTIENEKYEALWTEFISFYQENLLRETRLFPNLEEILTHLESSNIPWGIVTNKGTQSTLAILDGLKLRERAACVVCGDTLSTSKPDPAPILHACELIKVNPVNCLYVGDAITDVIASKAAGTKSMVALYGYIGAEENPLAWLADAYISHPKEILKYL